MNQGRPPNDANPFPSVQPNPAVQKLQNPETASSPVGIENQRVKTPPVTVESDEGKVFLNLTSKVNQPRVAEKRNNPYSVSSLMANDEQPTKRSDHEQLKFSTLLQEMSQSRRPEHLGNLQTTDAPGQFMDLNNTRSQLSSSLIRQVQPERGGALGAPGESQAQSMGTFPKPVPGIQSTLNRPAGVSSFMNMRSPGNVMNQDLAGFNPRTMYPGYPSHGEFQRQQMMLLQQQQQQRQMVQRDNYHMAGSMMANGMPRNVPPEYAAYYAQRPMFDAMMGQYKNGTRPPTMDGKL